MTAMDANTGQLFEDVERVAWVFPGQGSQAVGMGKALFEAYPQIRELYDRADRLLGRPLTSVCFEGPADELQLTVNAQPALLVTGLAHLEALRLRYPGQFDRARFVAGHSLGEYTALVASGVLSFDDGLRMVAERGRLMHEAGSALGQPTGMAAVLGLDEHEVARLCEQAGVELANLNAPGQVVISGPLDALELAGSLARERGARRVMPLQVSAAFHSRWMRPMAAQFADFIARFDFNPPRIPVVANVTARPVASEADIPRLLAEQTYSPVRWVESVQYMVGQGVNTFVEVGPGRVLSGLVKRIAPDAVVLASEDLLK